MIDPLAMPSSGELREEIRNELEELRIKLNAARSTLVVLLEVAEQSVDEGGASPGIKNAMAEARRLVAQ